MNTLRKTLAAALLAAGIARAAVPIEWDADVERPAAAPLAVVRGETAQLRCRLVRRGRPWDPVAAGATLYWQTNGMGSAWWSVPASVSSNELSAVWTPAMDPGGPVVSLFLGASDAASGLVYRAAAMLRILPGPGPDPAYVAPPVQTLDFNRLAVENAPWNDIGTAATNYADRAAAAMLDEAKGYTDGAVSGCVAEEVDPSFWSWIATNDFSGGGIAAEQDPTIGLTNGTIYIHGATLTPPSAQEIGGATAYTTAVSNKLEGAVSASTAYTTAVSNKLEGALVLVGSDATNYTDAVTADLASHTDVAAAVTNYYELSSLGRIYVTTNGILVIQAREATTKDWFDVWDSSEVNATMRAMIARMAQTESIVQGAVSDWASYDAQGIANPDDDTILLNRAYTAIGAGFFWASSGGHYCLCSSGTVAFAAGTEGSFRIFGESYSNYVGLVQGGSIVVGANANGFAVTGTGANAIASITYPYSGGDYPVIYGAATLAGPWTEMSSPVWVVDANAGTATASFPATADSFFYKATSTLTIGEYFHATVSSYFEGGVKTSAVDMDPVRYDSKVEITAGGHTYRIPAELVQ